jgi:hypothetical protein
MMDLFQALESSGFSMLLKENSTIYVAILAFHTIGLSFLVGISGTTALRILGVAPSIPLRPMKGFFPLMWAGFWINAFTGSLLLCLYPTDYFVDVSFYIKIVCVVTAIVLVRKMQATIFGNDVDTDVAAETGEARNLAKLMLVVWLVATVTGRVMAYSIPTKVQTGLAVVIFLGVALLVGKFAGRRLGLTAS